MKATLNHLQEHLQKNDYLPKIQQETQQVYVILKISNLDFPLFFRIFEQSHLLQLLTFFPTKIKPDTHSDMARLLHYLNKDLDIPGFGMDEHNALAFYRIMLPILDNKMNTTLLNAYIKSTELVCETMSPTVLAIANATMRFDEVLSKK